MTKSNARQPTRHAILVLIVLMAPTTVQSDFAQSGTIVSVGAFGDGWSQSGTVSTTDPSGDQSGSATNDLVKVYFALATQSGGVSASASNPIEWLYLRYDHGNNKAQSIKMNMQVNLGAADAGKVDHLLQALIDKDGNIEFNLLEYNTPYPDIAAFTTGSLTLRLSNLPADGAAYNSTPISYRTGNWGGGHGFELAVPIAWLTDANLPVSQLKPDGTGVPFMSGAFFSSSGTIGGVGSVKDELDDGAGTTLAIAVSTESGSASFQPAVAEALGYVSQPTQTIQGQSLPDVTVEVLDGSSARVTDSTHPVTIALANDPAGGSTLSGTKTVNAVAGLATFTGLSIDNAGSGFTLIASGAGLSNVTSTAFDVVAAVHGISVASHPVHANGTTAAGASWGVWEADPAAINVTSSNFLQVNSTSNVDGTRFTVDFTAATFQGAQDASWSIGIDNNIQFACAQTLTGQPPSALTYTWATSSNGAVECTFGPGSAGTGIMYVQYRLLALPATLFDQNYSAGFTVTESTP